MSRWVAAAFMVVFVPGIFGQWTPAPAQPQSYPQSQYPDLNQGAQPPTGSPSGGDYPDPADMQHGVARISIVQGEVNVLRGDNNQLTGAIVNAPLMAHDHLQTSQGSRAEIQFDAGTIVRLAPNTDLVMASLQYQRAQIQLALGSIVFRVLPRAGTQVEIDTPSVGVRAVTQGEYRISVFDNGTSQITVRSGQIELSGPRGSERIDAGRSVLVRGDASNPEMQTTGLPNLDQFDEWSEGRDAAFAAPQSSQYVSADIQGAADLDQYGNWVPSGYGQVWRPQGVASDWSPYSNGQWSYVDYYGWSWVDYSPWGWAPYHYGRWFWNSGYGWCWYPGGAGYRAYWSPALVGFFGFGGRVGLGFGGLGWVALAPFEPYHRWWGGGYGYGARGGFTLAGYRNAGIRGGAMTTSYSSFGSPHVRFAAATRGDIQAASAFTGRLPVSASRTSYSYSSRQPVANGRFSSVGSRSFYHQSAQPNQPSFSRFNNSSSSSGWRSFGKPGNGAASYFAQSPRVSESSGWHSFGTPRYSAPRQAQPHYSAPSAPRSGNGGSHSGGGGGGHRGR